MPNFFLVAGPNGVGKSTKCIDILPKYCEIIDYDYIYAAHFRTLDATMQKQERRDLANEKALDEIESIKRNAFETYRDVAIHSNLSPYSHDLTSEFSDKGYTTHLYFLTSYSVDVCKFRVKQRAYLGEHNIDEATIEHKFVHGLKNLETYHQLFDKTVIFDNTEGQLYRVAKFEKDRLVEFRNEIPTALEKILGFVVDAQDDNKLKRKKGLDLSSWGE